MAAIDLGPEKMALARKLGAEITIDALIRIRQKKSRSRLAGHTECW